MKLLIIILTLISTQCTYSQIRINEVCSSNSESLYDEDSDTPDWIELYNYSDKPVNLSNWKVSDKNDFQNAWQLPDTTIEPGGYFLVYASGKARYSSGYYAMNMKSVNSITNFDFHEEYRYRYIEIEGDFESTLEIKSMNNENLWAVAGLKIQDTLSNITNFFSTFASAKQKGGYFAFKRENKSEYPAWIPMYGVVNLPYSKIGLERKGDTLYTHYYDRLGKIYKQKTHQNFLPNKIYWGISVSSENSNDYGQLVMDNLILNGDTINFNTLKLHEETNSEIGYDYDYNECHADFSIKGGESIYLFHNSNLSDTVLTTETVSDITNVYFEGKLGITDKPTPGTSNKSVYLGRVDKPIINYENGIVSIESESGSEVYYTLDGSIPTVNSNKYKKEIILNSTDKLITAVSLRENYLNSFPSFKTDKINFNNKNFPVITISSDSVSLWGQYGLFSDFGKGIDLRINGRIEYKSKLNNFNDNVVIKLHGNTSRLLPQKSFRIYADELKTFGTLKNVFFQNSEIKNYDQIVLRNGGTDWGELILRDAFTSVLAKQVPGQISASYKPALAFLNKDFYGILNIRERIDDDFIANWFDIDDDNINYYEDNGVLIKGDYFGYLNLKNFVKNTDFNQVSNYNIIDSLIDIKNYIGYISLELFGANHDWSWKNVKVFQSNDLDGKFRYLVHDMDWTYGLYDYKPWDTKLQKLLNELDSDFSIIFKKFLENKKFKNEFINTYCDLMNSVFLPGKMNHLLDSLANNIRPIIPIQQQRWPESVVNWEEELIEMKNFINERPFYARHFLDYELNDTSGVAQLNLTSFPNNAGGFKVNTLTIDEPEWSGKYLQEVPVTITAVPKEGYKFKKWNIDSLGTDAMITATLPDTINVQAIYEDADPSDNRINIVINEIMYNADKDKDTKDWIELYNAGKKEVNLNGWSLIDEDETHTLFVLNEDYTIQPGEYVILTKSRTDFESIVDIDNKLFGDFDFGFGGNDLVKLLDANGVMHDTVNYDNDLPWPEGADGTGYTIELIHPSLDNSLAENWELSKPELGTAGFVNSVYDDTKVSEVNINSNSQFNIDFTDKQLNIRSDNEITGISLYDMSGKEIYLDYSIIFNTVKSNLKGIFNGLYLLNVQLVNGQEESVKLIID